MTEDALIGQQLDEYRLEDLLGKGGMARVYQALDVRLKRRVAIKVIDTPFRTASDYVSRFEREAQAIAQLEHPHIVRLYRYGEVDQLLYMAMQYVEGAPLSSVLDGYREDGEFIEPEEASRIVREICQALDYAHRKGVIHRDIKPSNIMLTSQGSAILADFGLALLTDVGTRGEIFGTPHYIAPEQAISSAGAVPQSDLYSLGVIIYEMFTNELPFDAGQPLDIAMMHMTEPPPSPRDFRPELSPGLERVILQSLAKESKERYSSGIALADALDEALQAGAITRNASRPVSASMSVPDRVAMNLGDHTLPPPPAAISDPTPALPANTAPVPPPQPIEAEIEPEAKPVETSAASVSQPDEPMQSVSDYNPTQDISPKTNDFESTVRSEAPSFTIADSRPSGGPSVAGSRADSPAAADKRSFIYIGVGVGLVLVVMILLAVVFGLGLLLWQQSDDKGSVAANLPLTETTPDTAKTKPTNDGLEATVSTETSTGARVTVPVETEIPATIEITVTNEADNASGPVPEPSPTPTEPPATEAPTAVPQLVADSIADFAAAETPWEYLAARPVNSDNFDKMQLATRQYGNCWYDQDYIRICPNSGHPGNGADVAWRWTSKADGLGQVVVSAHKIDQGGDGVVIELYHNGRFIRSLPIAARDTQGISQQVIYEAALTRGDQLLFIMKHNGSADSDHTSFHAQIYQSITP